MMFTHAVPHASKLLESCILRESISEALMKNLLVLTMLLFLAGSLFAQAPAHQPMAAPATAPAIDMQLANTLSILEQCAQATNGALGRMRVDKWKTDSPTKEQSKENVQALQRNLSNAIPELVGKVRQAPQDTNANFRLYRNVITVYDVLANVAETAGAFGPRDQYDAVAQQVSTLDQVRRALGERMDQLTASKEAELTRLHAQVQAVAQAQAAAPVKKIVVDDDSAAKPKKTKSKKPSTAQNQPATPQSAKPNPQ